MIVAVSQPSVSNALARATAPDQSKLRLALAQKCDLHNGLTIAQARFVPKPILDHQPQQPPLNFISKLGALFSSPTPIAANPKLLEHTKFDAEKSELLSRLGQELAARDVNSILRDCRTSSARLARPHVGGAALFGSAFTAQGVNRDAMISLLADKDLAELLTVLAKKCGIFPQGKNLSGEEACTLAEGIRAAIRVGESQFVEGVATSVSLPTTIDANGLYAPSTNSETMYAPVAQARLCSLLDEIESKLRCQTLSADTIRKILNKTSRVAEISPPDARNLLKAALSSANRGNIPLEVFGGRELGSLESRIRALISNAELELPTRVSEVAFLEAVTLAIKTVSQPNRDLFSSIQNLLSDRSRGYLLPVEAFGNSFTYAFKSYGDPEMARIHLERSIQSLNSAASWLSKDLHGGVSVPVPPEGITALNASEVVHNLRKGRDAFAQAHKFEAFYEGDGALGKGAIDRDERARLTQEAQQELGDLCAALVLVYGEITNGHKITEKIDGILAARRIDTMDRQPLMDYLCAVYDLPRINLIQLTQREAWEIRSQLIDAGNDTPRPCSKLAPNKFRPLSEYETQTLIEFALLGL